MLYNEYNEDESLVEEDLTSEDTEEETEEETEEDSDIEEEDDFGEEI